MAGKDDDEEYKETDGASCSSGALEEEAVNVAAAVAATTAAAAAAAGTNDDDSSFPQLLPHFESLLQQIADANWKKNYLALVQKNRSQESNKEKGNQSSSTTTSSATASSSTPLDNWIKEQQLLYNKFIQQFEVNSNNSMEQATTPTTPLPSSQMCSMFHKIELLRLLGITFVRSDDNKSKSNHAQSTNLSVDPSVSNKAQQQSNKRKADWEANVNKIREYRDEHGHVDVREKEDASLKHWLTRQRKRLKGTLKTSFTPLTDQERQRLEDVGIDTLTKKKFAAIMSEQSTAGSNGKRTPTNGTGTPKSLEDPEVFEQNFQEMKRFYQQHGHTVVPEKKDYFKLRKFLKEVRQEYKKIKVGQTSEYLTPMRMERLREINCSFEARVKVSWEERFEQWVQYRKEHGPQDPPSRTPLGKWITTTRSRYHDTMEQKKVSYTKSDYLYLTAEQIAKLRRHNFQFGQRDNTIVRKSWDERYADLIAFGKEHGHVDVPQRHPGLGEWVHHQRGRRKTMSRDRVEKLERIGFKWFSAARSRRKEPTAQESEESSSEEEEEEEEAGAVVPPPRSPQQRFYHHHHLPTNRWV